MDSLKAPWGAAGEDVAGEWREAMFIKPDDLSHHLVKYLEAERVRGREFPVP